MAVHEAFAGFEWIYTTLSADSQLAELAPGGVWRSLAPPETATPFVVMSLQGGLDVTTANAFRIMDNLQYTVKVVGPADISPTIANAASRVDALIGSPPTSGSVVGGAILSSSRLSPLAIDELVNGELWWNVGGIYQLLIEQT